MYPIFQFSVHLSPENNQVVVHLPFRMVSNLQVTATHSSGEWVVFDTKMWPGETPKTQMFHGSQSTTPPPDATSTIPRRPSRRPSIPPPSTPRRPANRRAATNPPATRRSFSRPPPNRRRALSQSPRRSFPRNIANNRTPHPLRQCCKCLTRFSPNSRIDSYPSLCSRCFCSSCRNKENNSDNWAGEDNSPKGWQLQFWDQTRQRRAGRGWTPITSLYIAPGSTPKTIMVRRRELPSRRSRRGDPDANPSEESTSENQTNTSSRRERRKERRQAQRAKKRAAKNNRQTARASILAQVAASTPAQEEEEETHPKSMEQPKPEPESTQDLTLALPKPTHSRPPPTNVKFDKVINYDLPEVKYSVAPLDQPFTGRLKNTHIVIQKICKFVLPLADSSNKQEMSAETQNFFCNHCDFHNETRVFCLICSRPHLALKIEEIARKLWQFKLTGCPRCILELQKEDICTRRPKITKSTWPKVSPKEYISQIIMDNLDEADFYNM